MSIDEAFPRTVGKMAHEYIQNHIRQSDITITAHGDGGSLHFFHLSDILYITACGKNSYIKTLSGEIPVHLSIKELEQQTVGSMLLIHRSYLVNPAYITSVERYTVNMINGDKLPVPAKKFSDMRETLLKMHCILNKSDFTDL